MFRRILVPLDGSRFSEHAIPRAAQIASVGGGSLHLVTVALPETSAGPRTSPPSAADRDEAARAAERYLQEVEERIRASKGSVEVTRKVIPAGNVIRSLIREVDEEGSDLIAMTTHGRGAWARAWLGSVADGVLRQAHKPVLLIRPPESGEEEVDPGPAFPMDLPPFRRILVPLDGSRAGRAALAPARDLAGAKGARLTLFQAVPPPTAGAYPYMTLPAREEDLPENLLAEARAELEKVAVGLRDRGLSVDVRVDVHNQPGLAILRHLEKEGADLVAMSTRGRGGVARLILGSVADKVIRGSPVPVLVYRPEVED